MPRISARKFCQCTYISESGLRSHYQDRHAAIYHRRGPATFVTDFPAVIQSVSQVNRWMNSRQRHRGSAPETVLQDSNATAFLQLMSGELATNDLFGLYGEWAINDLFEEWNVPTRLLSYAVATHIRIFRNSMRKTASEIACHVCKSSQLLWSFVQRSSSKLWPWTLLSSAPYLIIPIDNFWIRCCTLYSSCSSFSGGTRKFHMGEL